MLKKIYNLVLYNYTIKKIAHKALQNKFVVNNFFYKKTYERIIRRKIAQFDKLPYRLMIENTNACNSDCVFCPHPIMRRRVGIMDFGLYEKIVRQARGLNIDYLTIYGFGEPLLDPYFFKRVKLAKELGIGRVTTNTNGSLLNKDKIKNIIVSGLDEIYISFDANSDSTYKKIRPALDFKTVARNIRTMAYAKKKYRFKKPEIVLSFVRTPTNTDEVSGYIKKWSKIVNHISISELHNWTGQVENESGNILAKQKRDPCRLLWTDMTIDWLGRVVLCCTDYESQEVLGDLNFQTIREIWSGKKLANFRQDHLQGNFNNIKLCADCSYNLHHKPPLWVGK